ncbi:uncharacterized protein TM35_000072580 [Trypanosoma theileri]|uniref:Uncharacterized protein n=1 Tax=Trypanosoma theileri TaxID=67003 RepID=A0A1X0P1K3_9TRYP|nr:uncharacterized protein TM35_000072580 [Trypanosoma theileri]ORC90834.1 hypothetical protein TM35_000072580 [Trypanosoma theileri]
MERLPPIDSRVETLRLLYGSLVRLCLHTFASYAGRSLLARCLQRGGPATWGRQALPYAAALGAEVLLSALVCPRQYLAAVTTPRFLLDYVLTGWSDVLRRLDGFAPGKFAAYALQAFASDAEWNFGFFTWQLPSVALTLAKLCWRRRTLGPTRTRTLRVLMMLPVQVMLRAYVATFSVMIPESVGEVTESIVSAVLEGMVTSYLARHTWPLADLTDSPQTSSTDNSDGRDTGSEDSPQKREVTS